MTLPLDPAAVVAAGLSPLLAGVAAGLLTPPMLRVLPEPELVGGEEKVPYRELPAGRLALGAALWAAALTLATVIALPVAAWAPYVTVALAGSVGCIIDAATTWLPKRVLHLGWLATAIALVTATGAAGWGPMPLVRAGIGAVLVAGLLWIAHALGALGYSDVRLGLLTGGITAWLSWEMLYAGLLFGTLVGAGWGVAHAVRRGRGIPFPYGPSLLFGPYLAVIASSLSR